MNALAAIHVGKKALGLDEDAYRAVLERVTGKRSAGDMTPGERDAVLAEMRRLGFVPAAGQRPASRRASGPYAAKLQALWIAAWNLGVVRNRDDAAMIAFVERQTGIAHTRFLGDAGEAAKAIEALKKWLGREAGVDWSAAPPVARARRPHLDDPRYRIVVAQWVKLIAIGAVQPFAPHVEANDLGSLEAKYGYRVTGKGGFQFYGSDDWIALMNALGRKLRGALARRAETAGG